MKQIIAPLIIAGMAFGVTPGYAAIPPDSGAETARNCLGLNGQFDKQAFAEALKSCPDFDASINRQAFVQAMTEAAQKCPVLNGQMDPTGFAQAFVTAAEKCPDLKGKVTPEVLAIAARYCPWVRGKIDAVALAAAAQKCPGLQRMAVQAKDAQPGADPATAKVDAKMRAIVKALENNKKSADTLIDAAREANARPEVISEMEKISAAFRQCFMNAVSPQQIIESILNAHKTPDGYAGLIITAPDGTTWLISPQMAPSMPPVPPHRVGPRPAPHQPHQPAPRPDMGGLPGIQLPPPGVFQNPALRIPPAPQQPRSQIQPAPQQAKPGAPAQMQPSPKMIIMEESDMPYWPTREQLGKEGVLKYLEKRAQKEANKPVKNEF